MPKKQADGRYRGKVVVNGEAHYFSARTLAEYNREKERVKAYWRDGVRPDDVEWSQAVVEWYETYKKPNISVGNQKAYESIINRHVAPAFAGRMLKAIRRPELKRFIDSFSGMSGTAITVTLAIIKGVFNSAEADGIIQVNPITGLQRPKSKPPAEKDMLTEEQTAHYLHVAETHPDGLMLYGLYYLGVRRGELLGLRWEDVDWQSNTIHVQRDVDFAAGGAIGDLKTSAADRHIPLMSDFRQILAANRSLPQYHIFHGRDPMRPLCESTFQRKWRSLRAELGFYITPHWLRHNFISLCYDAGIKPEETMRIVGHADYSTTVNVYTHIKNKRMEKVSADLDAAFNKQVAGKLPEAK